MPPLSAEPSPQDDWDPRSPAVLQDQLAAYDEMRGRCPVAHSEYLGWSLFRGPKAGPNPFRATGLEWTTPSPPPTDNFAVPPVVTEGPYEYRS